MHPDAIIAGLRRELAGLDTSAQDFEERKSAIEQEIAATDKLPRPEIKPEQPETVFDHDREYLQALKDELARSEADRQDEIKAEIASVEAKLSQPAEEVKSDEEETVTDVETPSAEEIEQRKELRTGQQVERATNDPQDLAKRGDDDASSQENA